MDRSSQSVSSSGLRGQDANGSDGRRSRAFWTLQAIFWPGFFAMRAIAAAHYYPQLFWGYMGQRVVIVAGYAGLTTLIHFAVRRLRRWTPSRRLMLTLLLCAFAAYPMNALEETLTHNNDPTWPSIQFLDYVAQFGWVLLAWAGYDFAQDWAHEVRCQSAALNHAQALAHAAHVKMLRYQLNPHFLFNSLNAISTLVLEKRNDEAEGMLLRLSRFLRHTVDSEPTALARLGDEAQLQRLYLEMEAVRFGDKMQVLCTVPEALHDALAPSLLLQPIVENAIKHGVAKSVGTARIAITASSENGRLFLVVENDGPPLGAHSDAGVGLRNTRERLHAIYGDNATLTVAPRPDGGVRVAFDLPLQRAEQSSAPA